MKRGDASSHLGAVPRRSHPSQEAMSLLPSFGECAEQDSSLGVLGVTMESLWPISKQLRSV